MEVAVFISAALLVWAFVFDKPSRIWPLSSSSDDPAGSALIIHPETGRVFSVPALADLDKALLLRRSKNQEQATPHGGTPLGPFSDN